MSEQEFVKKAKSLGYSTEFIKDTIKTHEEAKQKGIIIPWDSILLDELPIDG